MLFSGVAQVADATLVVSDVGDGVTMHGRLLLVDVACGIFVVSRKIPLPGAPEFSRASQNAGRRGNPSSCIDKPSGQSNDLD